MTGKHVLPENDLLEIAAALKRFEYLSLSKELKKQASVAEKQYQDFDKVFNYDEKEEPLKIEKEEPLTIDASSLFYNNKYTFNEFKNVGKYEDECLESRYNIYLTPFKNRLKEFEKFTPRTVKTKRNKKIVYKNARELYSKLISIYYNDYNDIIDEEKKGWVKNIILKIYLLKVKDLLKMNKKVNHARKKLLLKE